MPEQNETIEVRKSGGTRAIEITLSNEVGVQFPGCHYVVTARTVPKVENFFRNLGTGKRGPAHLYGSMWQAPVDVATIDPLRNPNGVPKVPLDVWDINRSTGDLENRFIVNQPGMPLKWEGQLNLSFLRMAGISDAKGVKFGVKDPISGPALIRLRNEIREVVGDFYAEYLEPTTASITVVVED